MCDAVIALFNLSIPLFLLKNSFKFPAVLFLLKMKKKRARAIFNLLAAYSVRRCSTPHLTLNIHFTAFIMYSIHHQLYIATLELFAIRTIKCRGVADGSESVTLPLCVILALHYIHLSDCR